MALQVALDGRWHPGFDENWHLLKAASEPWVNFQEELRWLAHPPLYILVLRGLTPLGGSTLLPRTIGMAASVAATLLAYGCAGQLGASRGARWFAATAMALSAPAVNLAVCIRGYELATAFTLGFVFVYLRVWNRPDEVTSREILVGTVLGLLAIWTEYSATLVVAACGLPMLARLFSDAELRALISGRPDLRAAGRCVAALLAIGLTGWLAYLRWTHGMDLQGHVSRFHRSSGEGFLEFVWRGARGTLGGFLPFHRPDEPASSFAVVAVVGCAVSLIAGWRERRVGRSLPASALIAVVFLSTWGVVALLGNFSLYPHGGRMRHQSLLFPLLVLVATATLDGWMRRLPVPSIRATLWAAAIGVVTAGGLWSARGQPLEEFSASVALFRDEFAGVLAQVEPDEVVYVSHIDAIAIYSHLRPATWRLQAGAPGGSDLFLVEPTTSERPPVRVLRETRVWWPPKTLDLAMAASLDRALAEHSAEKAWVVLLEVERGELSAAELDERRDDEPTRALLARFGLELRERRTYTTGDVLRVARVR